MLPTLLVLLAVQGSSSVSEEPLGLQESGESVPVRQAAAFVAPDAAILAALTDARDDQDFAEDAGYRRLLELMRSSAPVAPVASADGAVAPPPPSTTTPTTSARLLDHADVLAHPDAWRGQRVRFRGLVADMSAVRLSTPLGDSVDAFRAWVTDGDGSAGVAVDFLQQPPQLEFARDVVEVEGVFYRLVRYENRKNQQQTAPYVIAGGLKRLDPETLPRSTTFDALGKILIAAAVAFLVVRVLMLIRNSRSAPERRGGTPKRPLKPKIHADL